MVKYDYDTKYLVEVDYDYGNWQPVELFASLSTCAKFIKLATEGQRYSPDYRIIVLGSNNEIEIFDWNDLKEWFQWVTINAEADRTKRRNNSGRG